MAHITMDSKIVALLRNTAELAEGHYKFAAVGLDTKGNLVAAATNRTKTHPRQARYAKRAGQPHRVSLHAEIACLVRARKDIETLIVARIAQGDEGFRASKPCPVCTLAIREAGVVYVMYHDGQSWVRCLASDL